MEEKSSKFILYYKSFDTDKKRMIREAFLERTSLSYPSWYSKLARKRFSKLELEVLVKICGVVF